MNAVFDTIKELAGQQEDYIIRCRRTIHALAETAAQEFKTKAFILEQAKELGLPWEEVPTTSLIVKMDTGKPGPVVALRADIDALPMKEDPQNLKGPRTCVSSQENTCHACGHDAHSAMLLGAMRILHAIRGQLRGTVLFCFEEGEEPLTGVDALLQALEKYKVNRVWAIHVYAELEEGKISVEPGPRMAGACIPCVRFTGRSGHGSRPDLAINPLFCGASFLNNLCTAFCNEIPAGETVTMGITTFHCGTVNNIIDNTAEIGGSFRFFSKEAGEKAKEIFKRVAETTGAVPLQSGIPSGVLLLECPRRQRCGLRPVRPERIGGAVFRGRPGFLSALVRRRVLRPLAEPLPRGPGFPGNPQSGCRLWSRTPQRKI